MVGWHDGAFLVYGLSICIGIVLKAWKDCFDCVLKKSSLQFVTCRHIFALISF